MKTVTIDGKDYYARSHPRGYGYQIMEKTPIEGSDYRGTYRCLYHTGSKKLIEKYFNFIVEDNKIPVFPDTGKVICPEKIVVHKSKHFEAYYSVPTLEALEATFRYILVQEYTGQIDHMKPENAVKNDSGVTSAEEIESIPVIAVQEDVRRKWNKYVEEVRENSRYKKDWLNLKNVLEGKGNSFNAMEAFEQDQYELENIRLIK